MSHDQFTEELQALIARAREAQSIPLDDLISLIDAELCGLQMALDEGEAA